MTGLIISWIAMVVVAVSVVGCLENEPDNRLAEMANVTVTMQAEQNQRLIEANREVTEASKELVSHDSAARQDLIAASENLQKERAEIGRQRDLLDTDRKDLHRQRERDTFTAAAIQLLAQVLLVSLPLGLVGWLLYAAYFKANDTAANNQVLVEQLVLQNPILLSPPASRFESPTNLLDRSDKTSELIHLD